MGEGVRAFLAFEIEDYVRSAVARFMEPLTAHKCVRWVPPENLHVTVRFLGDTAPDKLAQIEERLTATLAKIGAIDIEFRNVGTFPADGEPRVYWVGMPEGRKPLMAVWKRIEDVVVALGWTRERQVYVPHLTLGRAKEGKPVGDAKTEFLRGAGRTFGRQTLRGVTLFRSELGSGPARYSVISRIPFGMAQFAAPPRAERS